MLIINTIYYLRILFRSYSINQMIFSFYTWIYCVQASYYTGLFHLKAIHTSKINKCHHLTTKYYCSKNKEILNQGWVLSFYSYLRINYRCATIKLIQKRLPKTTFLPLVIVSVIWDWNIIILIWKMKKMKVRDNVPKFIHLARNTSNRDITRLSEHPDSLL